MSSQPSRASALTEETCREYLNDVVFKLRPKNYGVKYPIWPGMVGIEVEMLLTKNAGEQEVPGIVPLQGSRGSLVSALRPLAADNNWKVSEDLADDGTPLVFKIDLNQEDALTFEPGGQLEFSSRPYPCLQDAVRRLRSVQEIIDGIATRHGWQCLQAGTNPWHTVGELGLQMPKQRYRAMDEFFTRIGPYGRRMMRQTCTIQTCLDFGPSEHSMARRYMASQLLAPFATAMFAYSPVIDRKPAGMPGFRARVWKNLDPSRTGTTSLSKIAKDLNKAACVGSYLEFVLNARVVFFEKENFRIPEKPLTLREWIRGSVEGQKGLPVPTMSDLETHLSLLFPEVRPRGFLEMRSIDCQARPWQIVPSAFYTGLLYEDSCLDRTIETLLPFMDKLPDVWEASAMGLKDPAVAEVSKKLMQLAWEGFKLLPPCFRGEGSDKALQVFAEDFTLKNRTPSCELTDEMRRLGTDFLSPDQIRKAEESWFEKLV